MMENWLGDPLVQSALLPFVVALVLLLVLRPVAGRWSGVAVVVALVVAVYLIRGFDLFPLRSTSKILLATAVAAIAGALLDLLRPGRWFKPLLFLAAAGVVIWLLWPRLKRLEGWELPLLGLGCALYGGWMVSALGSLKGRAARVDGVLLVLSATTALASLWAATALYGQLAGALAAAVSAKLLLDWLGKGVATPLLVVLPAVLLSVLLGVGALTYAKLPWYDLALLALLPLIARLPLPAAWPAWLDGLVIMAACSIPAAAALYMTWQEAGGALY